MSHKKILFVCAGNICRSPALQAVLEKKLREHSMDRKVHVESCGTTAFFIGEQADDRMREAAEKRGVKINHTAQLFEHRFFEEYDWIIAVDRDNFDLLNVWAENEQQKKKIHRASEFSTRYHNEDFPDPYYEPKSRFERIMDMAEDVAQGIIGILQKPQFRPDL